MALAALTQFEKAPAPLEAAFEEAASRAHLDTRDRALALHLVQGVLRWRLRLDWTLSRKVRFPFSRMDPLVLNILRLALFQVLFLDRVPAFAAVDEAVRQTRAAGKERLTGVVNGTLRALLRDRKGPRFPDPKRDPVGYLSRFHAFPPWIVEKWIREFGPKDAEALLTASNRVPGLVLRVNRVRTDRASLLARLRASGMRAEPTAFSPEGILVEGGRGPITHWEGFEEGLFQVQGEASQVCGLLLAPAPGERILDVCAGLGGKTTHLAALAGGVAGVVALDRDRGRLLSLRRTAERLGIYGIGCVAGDAPGDLRRLFRQRFHRICVDPPCSALGTLSKNPDGKWFRSEGDIPRLAAMQKRILEGAAALLEPGGHLLYGVCTLSREENEGVVEALLGTRDDMVCLDLRECAPPWAMGLLDEKGFLRTLPHIHGMEGFFAALLTRRKG